MRARVAARLAADAALTPAEAKVHALIQADPRWFLRAPVTAIALRAGVSPPTVVRCCRALGAAGLSDCKLRLAAALSASPTGVHAAVARGDPIDAVLAKVVAASLASIHGAATALDPRRLGRAVDALDAARRVDFVGAGQSAVVAQDAKHKFFRLGLSCEAHADAAMQRMSAALLEPGDVLFAISATGATRTVLDAVRIARDRRATVVGLTDAASPLARLADLVLAPGGAEDPAAHVPMLTRLQHLLVVDTLAAALSLRGGRSAQARHRRLKDVLRSGREPDTESDR